MKRRDFIKQTLLAAGMLASGPLTAQKAGATGKKAGGRAGGVIDAYCHFSNMEIIDFLEKNGGPKPHVFRGLFSNTPTLIDPDKRLALMDECGVEMSVFAPLPWLETAPAVHADPDLCARAARLMNDKMAEIAAGRPDRFRAVALLPTTNAEVMLTEFERAVKELKMLGGFIVTGPTVKEPDHPDYEKLYAKAVELDAPLWVHPSRPPFYPDYVGEKISKFQVWQGLSWLLDSSAAMVRLVFTGVFERYPDLKVIIHHH
ncbi:MAG: amidohydrolase family protein, partial [Desulfobacterales bacterium]|nr:amidohydrolase family protein [Desulfobacterales bacterium]